MGGAERTTERTRDRQGSAKPRPGFLREDHQKVCAREVAGQLGPNAWPDLVIELKDFVLRRKVSVRQDLEWRSTNRSSIRMLSTSLNKLEHPALLWAVPPFWLPDPAGFCSAISLK